MRIKYRNPSIATSVLILSLCIVVLAPTSAMALSTSTTLTTDQQQRLSNIKTKGDQEISRRLASLQALSAKITSSAKITAADKNSLSAEVTTEISGLTSLKTALDSATTLDAARVDAQNIITEYRVYALVTPKISLIKASDDQQVVEAKLIALAGKLQNRLNTAKAGGKDITVWQKTLDDMNTQVHNAQAISTPMEAKVLPLQPSDYNSDHTLLSGDADQLKQAHADNQAALNDAKTLLNDLKQS